MDVGRGIREWYRASRSGSRGEFLKDVQSLTSHSLIALLREEISSGARGRLRTKPELEALSRTACPNIEALKAAPPREQTLQWLFVHRGHLSSSSERILCRELPTCCVGEPAEGRADLLGFDDAHGEPILVELKDGSASDPLSGAILELLYHWAFHMRHKDDFRALLADFGCEPTVPCRLVLIAPHAFYDEAERRSSKRYGEFERAIAWITELAARNVVIIDLYALDSGWQREGIHFRLRKVHTR